MENNNMLFSKPKLYLLNVFIKKRKIEVITRIIVFVSTLAAITGCLMPMITININILGKNLYSKSVGILSLINKDNTGGIIGKTNPIGLQNMDGIGKNILNVITPPVSLYLAAILLVIIVMISTMINKLCRLRILLCIAALVIEVYLISIMQDLPSKIMSSVSINKISGTIDWTKFLEINVGIGHWIMLVAIIIMTISTIILNTINSNKKCKTKTINKGE